MNLLKQFIDEYAMTIIYALVTALAGAIATYAKKKIDEWINTKTKKELAKTVVTAIQQVYANLDGATRKAKAIDGLAQMLQEKGINVSEFEIDMLIEAAIGEAKNVFNKTEVKEENVINKDLTDFEDLSDVVYEASLIGKKYIA